MEREEARRRGGRGGRGGREARGGRAGGRRARGREGGREAALVTPKVEDELEILSQYSMANHYFITLTHLMTTLPTLKLVYGLGGLRLPKQLYFAHPEF